MSNRQEMMLLVGRRANMEDDTIVSLSKKINLADKVPPKLLWRLWFASVRSQLDRTAAFRSNIVIHACRKLKQQGGETEDIVKKAKGLGGFALEISECTLYRIPQDWFSRKGAFVKVNTLSLINCGLTSISASIGNCKWLEYLDLRENLLVDLPEEMSRLYLTELSLDHNRIQVFPFVLTKLPTLRSLSLAHNIIRRIPNSIGFLCKLNYFDLRENSIETVPETILTGSMRSLTTLALKGNPLNPEMQVLLQCNDKYDFSEFVERPSVQQLLFPSRGAWDKAKSAVRAISVVKQMQKMDATAHKERPDVTATMAEHIKQMDEIRNVSGLGPLAMSTKERMERIKKLHALEDGESSRKLNVETFGLSSIFRKKAVHVYAAEEESEESRNSSREQSVGDTKDDDNTLPEREKKLSLPEEERKGAYKVPPMLKASSDSTLLKSEGKSMPPKRPQKEVAFAAELNAKLAGLVADPDRRAKLRSDLPDPMPVVGKRSRSRRQSVSTGSPFEGGQNNYLLPKSEPPSRMEPSARTEPPSRMGAHPAPWMNDFYNGPELANRRKSLSPSPEYDRSVSPPPQSRAASRRNSVVGGMASRRGSVVGGMASTTAPITPVRSRSNSRAPSPLQSRPLSRQSSNVKLMWTSSTRASETIYRPIPTRHEQRRHSVAAQSPTRKSVPALIKASSYGRDMLHS